MKIGLVGCGRISNNHLNAISKVPDFELASVCDIIESRAVEKSKLYNCNFYAHFDEMLEKENLDIISIATPSGLHALQGIKAAQKKINVITEKPMAISLDDADQLINACDQNEVDLFVVKQNRLNPTMQLLKKSVEKGRFGKIYMVVCNIFWNRPQEYYDSSKWRGTWEFDGGAYMNQGSHYVDALQWLFGPVDYVMASTATRARKIETEDTGSAIIVFRNGIISSMNVTMLTYRKNFEGSITIIGENGTVKIGGVAVNKIEKWEFNNYDDDDELVDSINYNPPNVYGHGHLIFYQNIGSYYKGDNVKSTEGRSGRKSLEIISAIYLSAQKAKKISIPLIK